MHGHGARALLQQRRAFETRPSAEEESARHGMDMDVLYKSSELVDTESGYLQLIR